MKRTEEKMRALRAQMKTQNLEGFIIPRADEFQGEFVPPRAERLKFLTGFTGSAGIAVVLAEKAVLMSDGRYTIQLKAQTDPDFFETGDSVKEGPENWLISNAPEGARIGYDPWLHTPRQIEKLQSALSARKITLTPAVPNPLDEIWTQDRPESPGRNLEIFPEHIAGKTLAQKKKHIAQTLRDQGAFASVLTLPDSVCWLLNIRGGDVEFLPVALCRAVIYAEEVRPVSLVVEAEKCPADILAHIKGEAEIVEPQAFLSVLHALAREAHAQNLPVALDFAHVSQAVLTHLETAGARVIDRNDPCIAPKAIKSGAEQEAIRKAHVQDGVAIVKFLRWLDSEAPKGGQSEISAEEKLRAFRQERSSFKGDSFSTIAGFAANGAIVHYRADEQSNAVITPPGLLLVDSGGQYAEDAVYGTTDITRTLAIGSPTPEMRRHFTLVLQGHIALARAHFPEGTTGAQIDALARQPLWREGLDFAHGTGHGVGCYLGVHEAAASISPRGKDALKSGMLLSNEPGYYKEGAYGIRIESLVLVREAELCRETGAQMLRFETVTLAPIDRRLIEAAMLTDAERAWLDSYHLEVYEKLAPLLDPETKTWLRTQTRPL
ncbi:MAG: aminopeptidase P family protein [Alphaproteobacteria bacterium]|nr:aminopeptidase P family protein [Alphaproteobacteria bacterium]